MNPLAREAPEPPMHYDTLHTPIGNIYPVFNAHRLTAILFERPHMRAGQAPDHFIHQMGQYFSGALTEFSLDMELTCGTRFERAVWLALRDIPYGETRTYKWIADRVGSPSGARAAGRALGKNPLPLVLPCHRIIESSGALGGYASGLDIKGRLLRMEYYYREGASSSTLATRQPPDACP